MEVQVNANGSVSFLWKKSNMTLNDDIQYSSTKTNILFIKQASQGVQGKYFCNMKNECGEIQSGVINLSVKHSFKKKRLLNLYCKHDEVPRPPWPLVGMKSFINLALISPEDNAPRYNYVVEEDVDKYLEATTEINHNDIFGKCESGSLVWILGRPGSGKTTLLHKLTKDWTIQGNVLKYSKMHFFISLHVSKPNTIDDVLKLYYPKESEREEVLDDLESTDGESTCFMIDGLEEGHVTYDNDSVIYRLVYKLYLPQAMVIVATRPSLTAKLQQAPVTRLIEVVGFSRTQVFEYISKYPFHSNKQANCDLVQKLKDYLNVHNNVLHMCYLPVNLSMLCFLFKCRKALPRTETQIYEEFTKSIVLRALTACNERTCLYRLQDLKGRRKEEFDKTCQLAFQMILKYKQAIYQEEISIDFSDKCNTDNTPSLGLLTINRSAECNGLVDIYSFLHITLQKYLAAYYISKHNLLQSALPDLPSEEKKAVMKFYCGIVQSFEGKDDELVALFQDTFQNKESCLHRAHCAFESQQSSVCNHIIELGKGSLDISAVRLSLTDVIAIAFLISAASLPINSLKISSCGMAETELNIFLKSIKSTDFKSLQELDIHSNCFGPSGAIFLAEKLLDSHDLVSLNLSNNRIGSMGAVAVAKVLTINNNLQTISLACNKIHHGGAVALANALEKLF